MCLVTLIKWLNINNYFWNYVLQIQKRTVKLHNRVSWETETDLQDCPCKTKFLINKGDNPVHNSEVDTTSEGIPSYLSFWFCVP